MLQPYHQRNIHKLQRLRLEQPSQRNGIQDSERWPLGGQLQFHLLPLSNESSIGAQKIERTVSLATERVPKFYRGT